MVQFSICFPISLSRIGIHFAALSVSCRLLSRHSVRTSKEFSLEQARISPTYQVTYLLRWAHEMHESTSLDVNKANGLLTSNANSSSATRSHALQQVKAARIGVICQGASIAPHFCLCPADCFQDILFEQARNSLWKKLAFLRHIK